MGPVNCIHRMGLHAEAGLQRMCPVHYAGLVEIAAPSTSFSVLVVGVLILDGGPLHPYGLLKGALVRAASLDRSHLI